MKALLSFSFLILMSAGMASAQAVAVTHSSAALGFSFTLPADWQVMETSAQAKEQARQQAPTEEDKKGLACAEIGMTARHGNPPSVITEASLGFECYGQQMTEADLPGFASGVSSGLSQNFALAEPANGTYKLGTHPFWIERVKGTLKSRPDAPYTIEIACSLTKKAAVCWMTMAADDAALGVFEHTPVSLDGEAAEALVPANAFDKKPS